MLNVLSIPGTLASCFQDFFADKEYMMGQNRAATTGLLAAGSCKAGLRETFHNISEKLCESLLTFVSVLLDAKRGELSTYTPD